MSVHWTCFYEVQSSEHLREEYFVKQKWLRLDRKSSFCHSSSWYHQQARMIKRSSSWRQNVGSLCFVYFPAIVPLLFVVLNFGCNKKYARIIMCHVFIYMYIIYMNKLRSFFTENAEMLNLQKEKGLMCIVSRKRTKLCSFLFEIL